MRSATNQTQFDLIAYGGTEAGVVAAVRAARGGLRVALISSSESPYGFFPSLGALETHYPGVRSPLYREIRERIINHYRETYGEDSQQYMECVSLQDNNPMVTFEPHVAEEVFGKILAAEPTLSVFTGCRNLRIEKRDERLASLSVVRDQKPLHLRAERFIDCSYTGDLAAAAGAPYTIGREPRSAFGEPHAGRLFTKWRNGRFPQACLEGRLNVLPTWSTTDPLPGSTGEGDDCVQDYSFRICLTDDPNNRVPPPKPKNYDRGRYLPLLLSTAEKAKLPLPFHHRWLTQSIEEMIDNDHLFHGHALPNRKRSWNSTNLIGGGKAYAEAGAAQRAEIEQEHLDHALGLIHFLQHDPEVPERVREEARRWGLAADEFASTNNLPPSIYAREGRRIVGSYVYREQDCLQFDGLSRAPVHRDGIAFTEFALDSLPCSAERNDRSLPDGQFFEKEKSLPGSLPWRCLLPANTKNLIAATTPSVTHCAWGTVRQTASLLQLAETSALAAVFSIKTNLCLRSIDAVDLQLHLVEKGMMISFFNDFDMTEPKQWMEAALIFANHGFFADYDARPEEPLTPAVAELWIDGLDAVLTKRNENPNDRASRIRIAESQEASETLSIESFLQEIEKSGIDANADLPDRDQTITRRQALEILHATLVKRSVDSDQLPKSLTGNIR